MVNIMLLSYRDALVRAQQQRQVITAQEARRLPIISTHPLGRTDVPAPPAPPPLPHPSNHVQFPPPPPPPPPPPSPPPPEYSSSHATRPFTQADSMEVNVECDLSGPDEIPLALSPPPPPIHIEDTYSPFIRVMHDLGTVDQQTHDEQPEWRVNQHAAEEKREEEEDAYSDDDDSVEEEDIAFIQSIDTTLQYMTPERKKYCITGYAWRPGPALPNDSRLVVLFYEVRGSGDVYAVSRTEWERVVYDPCTGRTVRYYMPLFYI